MKRNAKLLTKTKRLVILSAIHAFSKKFGNINETALFALSSEKAISSKTDLRVARSITKNLFDEIPNLKIAGTDSTVINFCVNASKLLVEKSTGNVKIRGYEQILEASEKCLLDVDENETNDSFKLMNELK